MSRTRVLLVALAGVLVAASLAVPATAGKGKAAVHQPPFKLGPSGGDEWNFIDADGASGRMGVFRLFPGVPPVVGCTPEPAAGWATFKVKHKVDRPTDTVTVAFDAVMSTYSWVNVTVENQAGGFIGVGKLQGPHAGAGKVKVKLFRRPDVGTEITVKFGLQLGDACPQVEGAGANFESVKID
jgi:hypothetical protein